MIEFAYKCNKIPSVNHTYVRGNNDVFKRPEVSKYQKNLAQLAKIISGRGGFFNKEPLMVIIDFFVQNIHRDLDNMLKCTLDSLQGIAFENDKQVFRLHCSKFKSNESFELVKITIKELEYD